jgi:chromosome segregation ATPase
LTLQGIINSIAIFGGAVGTILVVLKYRREVRAKLEETQQKIEAQRKEEAEQRRKDELERFRIESEQERSKDALLLETHKELTARVRQAEQFAQGLIDGERAVRNEMQAEIDKARKRAHDVANEFHAAQMLWKEEKLALSVDHQKELAAVKLEYSRLTKDSSDCEQRIAELTKQLEQLRVDITPKNNPS